MRLVGVINAGDALAPMHALKRRRACQLVVAPPRFADDLIDLARTQLRLPIGCIAAIRNPSQPRFGKKQKLAYGWRCIQTNLQALK